MRDASVLLFDEPLTGLIDGIRRMRETILARPRGAAIIVSSHLCMVEEICTASSLDGGRSRRSVVSWLARGPCCSRLESGADLLRAPAATRPANTLTSKVRACTSSAARGTDARPAQRASAYWSAPSSGPHTGSVLARLWGSRAGIPRRGGRTPSPDTVLPILRTAGAGIAALGLLVLAALGWLLPFQSGLLDFTEAETQFLFPAPLLRRQLLMHRLMRSQLGLLFAAIVPAIAFPSSSVAGRVRFALSTWVLLVTAKVYFSGVTLARARLASPSARARRIAWLPIGLLVPALAVVGNAVSREFLNQAPATFSDGVTRLGQVGMHGLPGIMLWPFMALTRPLFAEWPSAYLAALAESLIVLGVTTAWMLRSDDAFLDAAAAVARRAAKTAAARTPAPRVRTTGWTLGRSGRVEGAFLWKNAMQMLRATSGVTLLRYLVPLIILGTVITSLMLSANQARGRAAALCMIAMAAAGFAVLLGPQIVRTDLRADLGHLELLKTWPVKAPAVIRGEMLWPVCGDARRWFGTCARRYSRRRRSGSDARPASVNASATALIAPASSPRNTSFITSPPSCCRHGAAWESAPRGSTRWGSGSSCLAAS